MWDLDVIFQVLEQFQTHGFKQNTVHCGKEKNLDITIKCQITHGM